MNEASGACWPVGSWQLAGVCGWAAGVGGPSRDIHSLDVAPSPFTAVANSEHTHSGSDTAHLSSLCPSATRPGSHHSPTSSHPTLLSTPHPAPPCRRSSPLARAAGHCTPSLLSSRPSLSQARLHQCQVSVSRPSTHVHWEYSDDHGGGATPRGYPVPQLRARARALLVYTQTPSPQPLQ